MSDSKIISKSSLQILREVRDNPGITIMEITQNLGKSFTSISRQFRDGHGPEFLKQLIVKETGTDRREKKMKIKNGKEDEVDTLVEALEIINSYEQQ